MIAVGICNLDEILKEILPKKLPELINQIETKFRA